MTLPFYASPEQIMRERSEIARRGIARGRSVVVLKYAGGILFVAEVPTKSTLRKVGEIYDRIGFAGTGRFSEFDRLRKAGIRHVDLWGYSYDRRDVSAKQLANVYAETLSSIFSESAKPFEVELAVAQVGDTPADDELYRLTYDGSIVDEPEFLVMGGQADVITTKVKAGFAAELELAPALDIAVRALSAHPANSTPAKDKNTPVTLLTSDKLEVAILDRTRPRRTFKRLENSALEALLPADAPATTTE
jgi:proteasome alpha subunit